MHPLWRPFAMRTLAVVFFALAVIATGARAEHCPGGVPPQDPTSIDHCRDVNTGICLYVDYGEDSCGNTEVWIVPYGESNGIPGYQGGDECGDNTCHGMIEADTIIF